MDTYFNSLFRQLLMQIGEADVRGAPQKWGKQQVSP